MKIMIHSVHFSADQKLRDFILKKVEKLETFFDRILDVHVSLKLENSGQVKDKWIEIKLSVPGHILVVKENSKTFEESTDKAVDTMARQLKKHKEKMKAVTSIKLEQL